MPLAAKSPPPVKQARARKPARAKTPKIGFVSLGCPKALVDSERIITRLRAEGYDLSPSYDGADAVVVNTCGFLNSAKEESLAAIGEALAENGKVIVTGCLGVESDRIRDRLPGRARRHRPASIRGCGGGSAQGRAAAARSLLRSAAAGRHQTDAAPLRLSEDLRRLQQCLQLLHHPATCAGSCRAVPSPM